MMSALKIVRQVSGLLLVAVFLFGITGMSVYRHACRSSNTLEVTAYPEFHGNDGDGCCATEEAGYISAPRDRFNANAPLSVDEAACCKSSLNVFRLEVVSLTLQKIPVPEQIAEISPLTQLTHVALAFEAGSPVRMAGYRAPPGKAGKQLVLFLRQPRVPCS